MQPPLPSLQSHFFSSLKQVEKRLKLENLTQHDALHSPSPRGNAPQFSAESNSVSAEESLSSPIYLHFDETRATASPNLQESSGPPIEFLSCSPQFPLPLQNPNQVSESNCRKPVDHVHDHSIDDIERLIQLLDLQDEFDEKTQESKTIDPGVRSRSGTSGHCECDNEFYAKIVGFKGPKCGMEIERLDGWIKLFLNGGDGEERLEPLRLAYLLLGKAALAASSDNGDDDGCFQFPSTVEDFLMNDPPKH